MIVGRREIFESFHFWGRNIFQLRDVKEARHVVPWCLLDKPQIELLEPCKPVADFLTVFEVYPLLQKISRDLAEGLGRLNAVGECPHC